MEEDDNREGSEKDDISKEIEGKLSISMTMVNYKPFLHESSNCDDQDAPPALTTFEVDDSSKSEISTPGSASQAGSKSLIDHSISPLSGAPAHARVRSRILRRYSKGKDQAKKPAHDGDKDNDANDHNEK